MVLASSPTLVLVSSRVKPYSFEAFIAVIYLFLLPLEKTLKKNILVFFLSLFSLLISFYSVFIIAGYYFAVIDYKKYKFKDNQNLYFGFFVFIFFVLSYNIYLSTLSGENKNIILENINQNKYIFQKFISNAKLKSKFTPKINFFIDDTFNEIDKIEKLLSNKKVKRDLNE